MKSAFVSVLVVAIGCGGKGEEPAPPAAENAAEQTTTAEAPGASSSVAVASSAAVTPPVSGSAPDHSVPDYGIKGPPDNPDPHLARQEALRLAAEVGMIGLLNSGKGGAEKAPWGRDSLGSDPLVARGNLLGDEIGTAYGAGGLGLSGIGRGGGGAEGIGLGNIGTIGHGAGTGSGQGFGSGAGRLGGASRAKPPSVRLGATSVSGKLPPEVIQRIVRQSFGRFRLCYENALRTSPNLEGRVMVSFVIDTKGSVNSVTAKTEMADASIASCVSKAFNTLTFPEPESGVVKVTYPINFSPGDTPSSASSPSASLPNAASPPSDPAPAKLLVPTIGGKALVDVGALEVEKALRDAGYTDISSAAKPGSKVVVFSAKKGTRVFTLTFVPASAPANSLATNEKNRLNAEAKVFTSGGLFLAVESDDKAASQALLDAIVKKP